MTTPDTTRRHSYDAEGPVDIAVHIGAGGVEVRLRDEPGVTVEISPAPDEASPWAEGLAGIMSWVMGEQQGTDLTAEAVTQASVDFGGDVLSVRSAKGGPLRGQPISVVVHAPAGSSVDIATQGANAAVTGRADRVEIGTGAGEITVEQATGPVRLTSGTAAIRMGPAPAGGHLRSGSGEIDVTSLGGSSTVATSGGMIRLGTVTADVLVRTGTGDIAVKEAVSGKIELTSGSGSFRVGVAAPAELDLVSTSSVARSEIPITQKRVAAAALHVTGRTGSGTILVHKAAG
ncbi:DUF4097 family beta strand repeat-containing protein [Actinokineospora guangxiensis]|uniref:DUF4097 family beta strand repeat-containing protein n=1 Tax=Actinokineospora guangxiensis TaxID=1490288 RepID=A0ABW0ESP5_9PSEU